MDADLSEWRIRILETPGSWRARRRLESAFPLSAETEVPVQLDSIEKRQIPVAEREESLDWESDGRFPGARESARYSLFELGILEVGRHARR